MKDKNENQQNKNQINKNQHQPGKRRGVAMKN